MEAKDAYEISDIERHIPDDNHTTFTIKFKFKALSLMKSLAHDTEKMIIQPSSEIGNIKEIDKRVFRFKVLKSIIESVEAYLDLEDERRKKAIYDEK